MQKTSIQRTNAKFGKRASPPARDEQRTGGPKHENSARGHVGSRRINCVDCWGGTTVPQIRVSAPELKSVSVMMVDTGAEPNLIKLGALKPHTQINAKEETKFSGVTSHTITTLGTTNVTLFGERFEFYVVPDSFPIPTRGILGRPFLENADVLMRSRCVRWRNLILPFDRTKPDSRPARLREMFGKVELDETFELAAEHDGSHTREIGRTLPIHSDATELGAKSSRDQSPLPTTAAQIPDRDDGTNDSDTDSSESGTEQNNNHATREGPTMVNTRDRLTMRRDNLVCFVSVDQHPLDQGGRDLVDEGKLEIPDDLETTVPRVIRGATYSTILLPITTYVTQKPSADGVLACIQSLCNTAEELGLSSFSISKIDFERAPWAYVNQVLLDLFSETRVKIFVCAHKVRIPSEGERRGILIENHASAFAGHKGINKTYRRIREKYYWPTLKSNVRDLVNSCVSCQKKKLTRVKTRQPMTITDTPGQVFDKISLDLVGPLPCTEAGNKYILTIQDLLSKYSLAIPLQDASATETADAFINHFVSRFGTPKAMLTDQGANFISSLMKAIATKLKITKFRTTAFHPQSNGSLERSHHVLTEYLKQYIEKSDRDKWLDLAMFSYNTSVHEGTQYTPHELVFGDPARVPTADTMLVETTNESYNQYLRDLQTKVTQVVSDARRNLMDAKEKSKRHYDRHVHIESFKVGERVMLLNELRRDKFDDEYLGPYEIRWVFPNGNVKIVVKGRMKIVHANRLKKFKPAPIASVFTARTSPPLPTTNDRGKNPRSTRSHSSLIQRTKHFIMWALILLVTIHQASGLIGYDCSGPTLNISTFSIVDQLDCSPQSIEPLTELKDIQLLQLGDFNETPVIQCRLEIDRTIYYCGMHSHVSVVHNGRQQYIFSTTHETCRNLQVTGTIAITPSVQVTGIQPNSTSHVSLTIAGRIDTQGTCSGTTYADPYGSWTDVVVQASVTVSIKNYVTPVKLDTNQVILRSGQRCSLQAGSCLDAEDGYTYWEPVPSDSCHFNHYDVLYEGRADKITSREQQTPTVYVVTAEDTTFALTKNMVFAGYGAKQGENTPRDHLTPSSENKTLSKQPGKKPGRHMQETDVGRTCWPWRKNNKQQPPRLPEQPGSATGRDGTLKYTARRSYRRTKSPVQK
ncbi:uncharacterized protein LOC143266138 [Megachile rotundata]|uniref:uncharacterized protein LOC143266138 n=1 Tax=Megachile rotundata TaxID=143995 RepID=UPI003FCEE7E0